MVFKKIQFCFVKKTQVVIFFIIFRILRMKKIITERNPNILTFHHCRKHLKWKNEKIALPTQLFKSFCIFSNTICKVIRVSILTTKFYTIKTMLLQPFMFCVFFSSAMAVLKQYIWFPVSNVLQCLTTCEQTNHYVWQSKNIRQAD